MNNKLPVYFVLVLIFLACTVMVNGQDAPAEAATTAAKAAVGTIEYSITAIFFGALFAVLLKY